MPTMEKLTEKKIPWYYDLAVLDPCGFVNLEIETRRDLGVDFIQAREIAMEELSLTALCIDIEVNPNRFLVKSLLFNGFNVG